MKQTEAAKQQWKQLFEVAGRIKQLKPWEYLSENDIVVIQAPERKEPIFCSVIGAGGEAFAVLVYPNFQSFSKRVQVFSHPDLPYYILAGRNDCLACNFGDRSELSPEDYNIVKDLGLKFRGKNQWIYFHSYKTGYAPWLLDSEEADVMISALQNFTMAFLCYAQGKLKVDFESGKILYRFYSGEKQQWFNCETDMPEIPEPVCKQVTVKDEIYTAKLWKAHKTARRIEMELFYMPTPIQEKKGERPFYPQMCLIGDKGSGRIVGQHMLANGEKEENVILSLLDGYIAQFGRPQSIQIRDETVEGLIGDFCAKCDIKIEKNVSLKAIDSFAEELLNSLA